MHVSLSRQKQLKSIRAVVAARQISGLVLVLRTQIFMNRVELHATFPESGQFLSYCMCMNLTLLSEKIGKFSKTQSVRLETFFFQLRHLFRTVQSEKDLPFFLPAML